MNASIYQYTVPLFQNALRSLLVLLDKGEAFTKEKGVAESELLDARIATDMFPFVKQVQMTCDNAKGCTSRLAGVENPAFEDKETSFAELKQRVQKTLSYLETFKEEQFVDADNRKITLAYFPDKHLSGVDYAKSYAIPNFYFHASMVYAILRMKDVQVGKSDYLTDIPWKVGA